MFYPTLNEKSLKKYILNPEYAMKVELIEKTWRKRANERDQN